MGSLVGGVIGNFIAPGIGGSIGSALGGALDKNSASKSSAAAAKAEADAAQAAANPIGVTGMFGTTAYDPTTRTLNIAGDPRLTELSDFALADMARQGEYVAELEGDPTAAAQKYLAMQRELMAPKQEQDRLALEERLLAQGMLGSTGGANRQQALAEAQAQQDLQAQYGAIDKAQSMIDTYRARQAEGLGTFENIGALPYKYAQLSQGIGADLGSAAESAAEMRNAATAARAQSKSNIAGIGSDIFKDIATNKGMFNGINWFGGN